MFLYKLFQNFLRYFVFVIKSRPKLLLIRGLGHSGTTILDLALGANPDVMGLGEAARLLRPPEITDAHDGPYRLRNDSPCRKTP